MIEYAYPQFWWLIFLPLAAYMFLPAAAKMYGDALKIPFVSDIIKIQSEFNSKVNTALPTHSVGGKFLLAMLMWGFAVAALCRPQWVGEPQRVHSEGRDILLVVDISQSMNERDFVYQRRQYDRLTAVKNVVDAFVDKRIEDKIGLVLFGTRAYLQVPLTFDRQALKEVLWQTEAGMAGNSTSIGDAVGVALKNMKSEEDNRANKVIVLLTDGENNDGALSMAQAINLAKQEGVKIYTIGVGSDERSFFGGLFTAPVDSGLDEASLQQLALETKGTYFRAKDVNSLMQIYDAINQLEPQEQEGRFVQETKELFYWPAAAAILLFLLLLKLTGKVW